MKAEIQGFTCRVSRFVAPGVFVCQELPAEASSAAGRLRTTPTSCLDPFFFEDRESGGRRCEGVQSLRTENALIGTFTQIFKKNLFNF